MTGGDNRPGVREYSHSRKAGNEGDVWKHALLLTVASKLTVDDRVHYVESHSGAPVHHLLDHGEWQRGVGRVASVAACDSQYRTAIMAWIDRME
jgi:23S rRNA A2030 N6-methylase RlmJ